tara:strand:- start:216 stop:452 length:237 start_codon:yes stop_codon:yes gene_type:complete
MFSKALTKALIVLVPTYIVAYLTEMMVYTIPMLAASSIFATTMFDKNKDELRVDEDGTPDDGGDSQDDDGTDTSTLSS